MTLETPIQTAVQTTIRDITGFKAARVTINDWGPYDITANEDNALVVIQNADNWKSEQHTVTQSNKWEVKLDLLVPTQRTDEDTHNLFRNKRDLLIAKFNEVGTARSPGGVSVTATVIRNEGSIFPYYDTYIAADDLLQAIPIYWGQTIVMEVETF